MRAQDQKLSRPPGSTRPDHRRGLRERTLEGFVRRLQLQKTCPVRVRNVANQKTHVPLVLCAFLAFKTETSLALPRSRVACCRQIMLVKRLPDQGLDYRLAADV